MCLSSIFGFAVFFHLSFQWCRIIRRAPSVSLGACLSLAPLRVYLSAHWSRALPLAPGLPLCLGPRVRSLARTLAQAWRITAAWLESSSLFRKLASLLSR